LGGYKIIEKKGVSFNILGGIGGDNIKDIKANIGASLNIKF